MTTHDHTPNDAMISRIKSELESIESASGVRILYACESGSRAWGFASTDSDYDVRFIYAHPRDWYLSMDVEYRRDVIERPLDDELDITGWDLRKTLQLLRKSNPPLLEKLDSPIVYRVDERFLSGMRQLAEEYFATTPCAYHYLHMARGNYREYLQCGTVRLKKYFYVLRPLLAIRWLEQGRGMVPMLFREMLDAVLPEEDVRRCIDDLLAAKTGGVELDDGPRVPTLNDFIEAELSRHESGRFSRKPVPPPNDSLNMFFRATVDRLA